MRRHRPPPPIPRAAAFGDGDDVDGTGRARTCSRAWRAGAGRGHTKRVRWPGRPRRPCPARAPSPNSSRAAAFMLVGVHPIVTVAPDPGRLCSSISQPSFYLRTWCRHWPGRTRKLSLASRSLQSSYVVLWCQAPRQIIVCRRCRSLVAVQVVFASLVQWMTEYHNDDLLE
jgi:hypothetical protein